MGLGALTLNTRGVLLPQLPGPPGICVHMCVSLTGAIPGEEPSPHLHPETSELLGPQRNSEGEVRQEGPVLQPFIVMWGLGANALT